MGSENKKKKTVSIMMYYALIFTAMFGLCFSAVQFDKKMNTTTPIPPGSHLMFPVQGDVYPHGIFRTTVALGNPPSPYFLDVDTGSDITWIQCYPDPEAKLYAGPHPPYIPKPDTEIILCKDPLCSDGELCDNPDDQCDYLVEYGDEGSSMGVMLKESFLLKFGDGNDFKSTLAFGCGYNQEDIKGPYYVDGVLGLSNAETSIIGQLSRMGFKNAHGHCFNRRGGGYAFIGDHDVPSETAWTAMLPNQEDHYIVGPVDLVVANTIVAKGLQVAFDSGATYTYLNEGTYQATLSLVNKGLEGKKLTTVQDENLPICWRAGNAFRSFDEVKSYFGNLFLIFSNEVQFVLPPEAYLIISSHGNACFGILNGKEAKLGDMNIIGSIAFQDKLLIYDNEQSKIGWAPKNCI